MENMWGDTSEGHVFQHACLITVGDAGNTHQSAGVSPMAVRSLTACSLFAGMILGSFTTILLGGMICQNLGWPFAFYIFGKLLSPQPQRGGSWERKDRRAATTGVVSPGWEASFLSRESTEHQQGAGREAQRPVRGEVSGRAQDKGTPQK